MSLLIAQSSITGQPPIIDTRANILAFPATSGRIAFATDTGKFYIADGSVWKEGEIRMRTDAQAPDMGYEAESAKGGYGADYVTDKRLANCLIGGNARTVNGGIRIDSTQDPDTFEMYLRSVWQTILYDLTYENDEFEHTPLSEMIDVWSGNSNLLGLNGLAIIQEYRVSMGAMPVPRTLDGGSF